MGVVDVRDVARMHIAAGFLPTAQGRYIANGGTRSMLELGQARRAKFGPGYPFPYVTTPKFMIKIGAAGRSVSSRAELRSRRGCPGSRYR